MADFFTFYSFKGGVGRSMAMANVADILARRGLRVLAIDFDLEAPGLERYFQVDKSAALANPGLIDLLQSFKKSLSGAAPMDDAAEFRQLQRFIFPVYQQPLPNGGELHLMTAGQRETASQYRSYALAVRTFDWQDFYFNWEGEAFFDWLRGALADPAIARQPYDVVLVDSRTGVTEMGGVCAYQLADVMVMLCAANHQNVEGTRAVVQDFRSDSVRALRRGRPLEIVVVPARIEQRDGTQLGRFFERFDRFFGDERPAAFDAAGLGYAGLTIPYQPEYAFEEIVVSDPERREQRRAIGSAFERLADALTLVAVPGGRLAALREAAMAALTALQPGQPQAARSTPQPPGDPFGSLLGGLSAAKATALDSLEDLFGLSAPPAGAAPGAGAADPFGLDAPTAPAAPASSAPVIPPTAPAAPATPAVIETTTRFDPTRRFAGFDVFLSYGAADEAAARQLQDALQRAGLSVFLDTSALTPGDQIAESIAQALHHCRHLLVCAGGQGVSAWQKREIELARDSSKAITVVPVLLPGAEQDIFSLALRGVADMQAVDLRDDPAGGPAFDRLLQLLRGTAGMARGDETTATPAAPAQNPYAGLAACDEGRVPLLDMPEPLLDVLQQRLQTTGCVLLTGPSGAGKASLVSALVARLRQAAATTAAPLSLLRLRPTDADAAQRLAAPAGPGQLLVVDRADRLAAALGPRPVGAGGAGGEAGSAGAAAPATLWPADVAALLSRRLAEAGPAAPVLLVADDLPLASWRQVGGEPAAAAGVGTAATAASAAGALAGGVPVWPPRGAVEVPLSARNASAIRRAIEAPAQRSGYAFEPGLLDRLCKDVGDGPGALLLAQQVLAALWPQAVRGFLTNAAYDAGDGVAGAWASHLNDRLAALPDRLRDAALALLLRLAVRADDGSVAWQPAVWEVVRSQPSLADGGLGAEALLWLMDQRVVSVWRESPERLCIALLQPLATGRCPTLDTLLDARQAQLVQRRRLVAALKAWQDRGESDDALLSGFRLGEAQGLQAAWGDHVCDTERAFIARSIAFVTAELKAQRARRNKALGIAAVVALMAVGLVSIWVSTKNQQADRAAAQLQEANDAFKAAVSQQTGQKVDDAPDPALFAGLRIVPQYKDARDEAAVQRLIAGLRAYGLNVTAPERVGPDKATCGDVRVFAARDQEAAKKLQEVAERVLLALGYSLPIDLIDLSLNTRLAQVGAGTLELWLPPLVSAAKAGTPPATNPKDGAELRLVGAGCAQLGMAQDTLRAVARAASQPMLELFSQDLPKQTQWIDGFQMYRTEVTNAQFARFQAACGGGAACPGDWSAGSQPAQAPARFVGWAQADAYCRWAGGRLPTELEWEKAARGTDGRLWPWGNTPDATLFHGREASRGKGPALVGSYPAGDSPYGIADLAGNLWEMTATPWPGGGHVMRGGSYLNPLLQVHSAWRWVNANERRGDDSLGFRCVVDLPATPAAAGPAAPVPSPARR